MPDVILGGSIYTVSQEQVQKAFELLAASLSDLCIYDDTHDLIEGLVPADSAPVVEDRPLTVPEQSTLMRAHYQNRVISQPGDFYWEICQSLVGLGLMKDTGNCPAPADTCTMYVLTETGKSRAEKIHQKLWNHLEGGATKPPESSPLAEDANSPV
jgi:hypothetical protein